MLTCDHQSTPLPASSDALILFRIFCSNFKAPETFVLLVLLLFRLHTHRSFKNCKFGLFIFALCFSLDSLDSAALSLTAVQFCLLCFALLVCLLRCRVPTLFSPFLSLSFGLCVCLSPTSQQQQRKCLLNAVVVFVVGGSRLEAAVLSSGNIGKKLRKRNFVCVFDFASASFASFHLWRQIAHSNLAAAAAVDGRIICVLVFVWRSWWSSRQIRS